MKNAIFRLTPPVLVLLACTVIAGKSTAHSAGAAEPQPLVEFTEPLPQHYVISNVRLVDPRTSNIIDNAFVEVAGGRIASLGDMASANFAADMKSVDGAGKTLVPGLIMVHEHLFYADHPEPVYIVREQPVAFPRMYLAGGITTARTGASVEPYTDLAIARGISTGSIAGPEILLTAPFVSSPGDPVFQAVAFEDPADITPFIDYWAGVGFSSVKLYMNASRALVSSTVQAAHARGMQVTGHLCATSYAEAAAAGIDNLEHGFGAATDFVEGRMPDTCSQANAAKLATMNPAHTAEQQLITDLIRHGVTLTSTLAVFESFSAGLPELDTLSSSLLSPDSRALYRARKARVDAGAADNHWGDAVKSMQAMELAFYRAGGRLVAGTDPTGVGRVLPGPGSIRTLELLQEAGLTPMEVLRIASSDAAQFLGIAGRTGSLAPGMEADFVLVDGEPDRDISALRKAHRVFSDGRAFMPEKLYASASSLVGGNRWDVQPVE